MIQTNHQNHQNRQKRIKIQILDVLDVKINGVNYFMDRLVVSPRNIVLDFDKEKVQY